ncbi:MotE family protein [Methylocapsa acidiphila]|uniref:MotE family protein n=1 Tax=Methylocapsa acidiphila TaxID=133552 RepID=UPI00040FB477|nr:hypothetical protein [Methylocapsa acidiphila]
MMRIPTARSAAAIWTILVVALAPVRGFGLDAEKTDIAKPAESKRVPVDIQQFCTNNSMAIGDARIAWQTTKLLELEKKVNERIAELDAKKNEFVNWLNMRNEAMRHATESVVAVYAHMRADAAASQLAVMDDAAAAAILAKLSSRAAGAILNEMEVARAARLGRLMAGPEPTFDGKKS